MKISFVIPNFNGCNLLKINLPKVIAVAKESEIIVVDDASTDESVSLLNTYFPKINIIAREKNEGFASAVNSGVREAKGEIIVLLNTDVIPAENFLDIAIKNFQDQSVFAVGFLQKCPENGKIVLRGRGIGKFERGFLIHSRGAVSDKDTSDSSEVEDFRKTLWVSGGAGMFRKSIWEILGGLDTLYNPFYWEDIDLSYRALKAGYKLVFEPRSVVDHHQQIGAIRSMYTPGKVKTIAYRNQIIFVWLNISDFQFIVNHLICLPYHIIKSLVTGDLFFVKASLMAILKISEIISHRIQNNKMSILSDKYLLSNYIN